MANDIAFLENRGKRVVNFCFFLGTIFLSQLLIFPWFLNPVNEARILAFSFLFFLAFFTYPPKKFSFFFVDILFLLALILFIAPTFFLRHHVHSLIPFLAIFTIYFYKFPIAYSLSLERMFLRVFTVFVLVASILGLYEYFNFISCGPSSEPLIPYLLPPDLTSRVAGVYGQPNFTALLLLLGLLVYLYSYLHDEAYISYSFRTLSYLPLLVVAVAFFLTGSRAGLLAFALIFVFLCWLVVRKRYLAEDHRKKRQFYFLLGVIAIAYCFSYGLTTLLLEWGGRAIIDTGTSTETRFVLWTAALLMFSHHPWLGIGLDNFRFELPKYVNWAYDSLGFVQYEAMGYTSWAHNEFLQIFCEGGIFVFFIVLLAGGYFLSNLYLFFKGRLSWSPLKLYSHLFLLPFLIQSNFSWPLRFSSIFILFIMFFSLLMSQYKGKLITVTRFWRNVVRLSALIGLVITLYLSIGEVRMGNLAKDVKINGANNSFDNFECLVEQPYLGYPLLLKVLPYYVQSALLNEDVALAEKILPYMQRLTEIQGTHWQWFYLSHIYYLLGRNEEAMSTITKAIDLWPTEQAYWGLQHYLNMIKASEDTGRPLKDFWPVPPGESVDELMKEFDIHDRVKIYK